MKTKSPPSKKKKKKAEEISLEEILQSSPQKRKEKSGEKSFAFSKKGLSLGKSSGMPKSSRKIKVHKTGPKELSNLLKNSEDEPLNEPTRKKEDYSVGEENPEERTLEEGPLGVLYGSRLEDSSSEFRGYGVNNASGEEFRGYTGESLQNQDNIQVYDPNSTRQKVMYDDSGNRGDSSNARDGMYPGERRQGESFYQPKTFEEQKKPKQSEQNIISSNKRSKQESDQPYYKGKYN